MRSCKISQWRLTRGSDRTRRGFYYFAPKRTPHYPGQHNLGSREWVTDDRIPGVDPPLGEWGGETEWYRGDAPAALPLAVLIGDPECIKNGERPGLPIIMDASARCAPTMPDACYSRIDLLLGKTNAADCAWGWKCLQIIDAAYTDLDAAALLVQDYLGPDATVTTFANVGDLFPACVIAIIRDTAFLWITGTTSLEQGAVQALYFGFGPTNQGAYECSQIYEDAAVVMAARLTAAGAFVGSTRFVLSGHSYGGAVAYVLAAKLKLANAGRRVEVVTHGMPQPGGASLRDIVNPFRQAHYVYEDDPVPYLPPVGIDFVSLFALMTAGLRLQWQRFFRPNHVITVAKNGTLLLTNTALIDTSIVYAAGLAVAQGLGSPAFTAHRSNWQLYRLCNACKCIAGPCVQPGEDVLNFDFEMTGLSFTDGFTPQTVSYSKTPLTVEGTDSWAAFEAGNRKVIIDGNVFHPEGTGKMGVRYFIDFEGAGTGSFIWYYSLDELMAGIDTTDLPLSLAGLNVATALTRLRIRPILP